MVGIVTIINATNRCLILQCSPFHHWIVNRISGWQVVWKHTFIFDSWETLTNSAIVIVLKYLSGNGAKTWSEPYRIYRRFFWGWSQTWGKRGTTLLCLYLVIKMIFEVATASWSCNDIRIANIIIVIMCSWYTTYLLRPGWLSWFVVSLILGCRLTTRYWFLFRLSKGILRTNFWDLFARWIAITFIHCWVFLTSSLGCIFLWRFFAWTTWFSFKVERPICGE